MIHAIESFLAVSFLSSMKSKLSIEAEAKYLLNKLDADLGIVKVWVHPSNVLQDLFRFSLFSKFVLLDGVSQGFSEIRFHSNEQLE